MRAVWIALACAVAACASPEDNAPEAATTKRVAILSDTHVIASTYTCCENGALDTTSI